MSVAIMVLAPKGSLENVSEVDLPHCLSMIERCDNKAFSGQKSEVPFEPVTNEYDGHVVYLHDEVHHMEEVHVVVLIPGLLRLPGDKLPESLIEELRNLRKALETKVTKMYSVPTGFVVEFEGGLSYVEGVISRLRQGRLTEV